MPAVSVTPSATAQVIWDTAIALKAPGDEARIELGDRVEAKRLQRWLFLERKRRIKAMLKQGLPLDSADPLRGIITYVDGGDLLLRHQKAPGVITITRANGKVERRGPAVAAKAKKKS